MIRHTVVAFSAALMLAASAYAQDEPANASSQDASAAGAALLPQSLNLPVLEGSSVPDDCQYPDTISDTTSFELACVTFPRINSGMMGAEYLAQLGQRGWRQGDYVEGGMTAVRTDERNCEHVLNLFPSDYPPGEQNSANTVIWFVLERAPRCAS